MKIFKVLLVLGIIFFISNSVYGPTISVEKEREMMSITRHYYRLERIKEYRAEQMDLYLEAIGSYESGNNPASWNKFGYIGKYQFGKAARKSTGFGHIDYWDFRDDHTIWTEEEQDVAMIKLMMKNQAHLNLIIIQCQRDGRMIEGIKVTKSGLLAAAHLSGAGNVKKYFRTGGRWNPEDAYGTSLETYLLHFSGYYF